MKYRSHIIAPLIAFVVMVCGSVRVSAQTDTQLSQYYETPSYYNPAAIGNIDMVRIRLGSRMQWVGIDNAPMTIMGTADMPVKLGTKRLAVGLMANQASEGLFRNLSVNLQAGYKFKLLKGVMTAGVQVGYANEVFRGSKVLIPDGDDFHESTDEAIPRTDVSGNALDFGAGVYYTHKYFWAGVSGTHLTSPTIKFSDGDKTGSSTSTDNNNGDYEFQLRRTLYFMAGGNIPIKNTLFEVMPSVMVKSDFTFTGAEANARLRYKKLFTFGLGYRYNDAVIATLAAEYKGFFIGYSYDYSTSAIAKASSGSHELVAGYSVKLNLSEKNKNKHKSIRIM